jgi:hypothetical protein
MRVAPLGLIRSHMADTSICKFGSLGCASTIASLTIKSFQNRWPFEAYSAPRTSKKHPTGYSIAHFTPAGRVLTVRCFRGCGGLS